MRQGLGLRVGVVALAASGLAACGHLPKFSGPLVQAPPACDEFAISIYFEPGSAAITREANALIGAAARRVRGCEVSTVDVVGLADAPGDPDANLALSKQRADAVTRVLSRRGFNTVTFQVAAAGDAGAQTGSGQARPLRRRADVLFHVKPGA